MTFLIVTMASRTTLTIEIPYDEEAGPCPWLYEELKDVKYWYERQARHTKLAGDVDRRVFIKDVRSCRVAFFGLRRLRSGDEKIYKVSPDSECHHLHHIDVSGWNEDVLQGVVAAIEGCLNTSLKTGHPHYHDVFTAPNLRPTKYIRFDKTFEKVWDFVAQCPDKENDTREAYVFRQEFYDLARYEKAHSTQAWVCWDRNMIVIQGDNESSVLRMRLRVRDFVATKTKQLATDAKRTTTKMTKQDPSRESTHRFDQNNPYTLLSKYGFGEKYLN